MPGSRRDSATERPVRSPFGYPIPGPGAARRLPMKTLADVPEGAEVEIDRVFEEDEQLLQFFHEEGIRPGVVACTEPVFVTVPAAASAGVLTAITTWPVAPTAIDGRVHVTALPAAAQLN